MRSFSRAILLCCKKRCLSIARFESLLPLEYKPLIDHPVVAVVSEKPVAEVTAPEDILRKIGEAVCLYPAFNLLLCRSDSSGSEYSPPAIQLFKVGKGLGVLRAAVQSLRPPKVVVRREHSAGSPHMKSNFICWDFGH